jgi:mono/diheme cytochrome c family protein/glucose/arabinose dehydrogenase
MRHLYLLIGLLILTGCGSDSNSPPREPGADAPMNVDIVDPDDIPEAPVRAAVEALSDFDVEDGFAVEIVATEPDVVDPVALSFDEDGAMWVVEMRDYMWTTEGDKSGEPAGRVVVLRDEDGDGSFETSSVFMDGLFLPRAIAAYNGGILLAVPPSLYFVERSGYEAGKMTLVDSTYAVGGNPEHQPNGLMLGLDNWIYNAKSDVRYRLRGGEWEKQKTEYRGQWGISQDDFGRLFYNNNSQTLLGDDMTPSALQVNPHRDIGDRRVYGPARASSRVWPRRVTPGVNRGYRPGTLDSTGRLVNVTSAAGPVIYRGDQFPSEYRGNAFVQETAANLVKRVVLHENAGRIEGIHAPEEGREFLTATDERFRPVNGYTAPDGSLFILDMYRGVIQHSTYLTEYLQRQIDMRDLDAPLGLGRIYRVRWRDSPLGPPPRLSSATNQDLVRYLTHENGWWRDTAQRLLIERNALDVQVALEALAIDANDPRTQIHALWTLEGLNRVTAYVLTGASRHPDARVRSAASQVAAAVGGVTGLSVLEGMTGEYDAVVARYVAGALATFEGPFRNRAWQAQVALADGHDGDPWIADAIIGSLEDLEQEFLDATGGGVLRPALTHAAGMALVRELNDVRLLPASFDDSFESGRDIYTAYCATCHGQDGAGLEAVAPPLLRSQWVLQDPERLVRLALDGIEGPVEVDGKTYASPDIVDHMPGIRQLAYSDRDIADVLTYVRNAWVNQSGGVTAEQVASVRGESERGPWTAQTLQETETNWTPLFNGQDLGGWTRINGQAPYSVEGDILVGTTVMNSPNSFLATDRTYGDFILEYEFLVDPAMNSGVQIRSNLNDNGRVFGYQVEIDPSDRAWTAGIYDEGRRGWLFNLNGRPAAQQAFRQNEWNHIRVEARGDHIRTWLNGVLAADLIDSMTAEGFIALQVHSIGDESQLGKTVQWRNIRIRELD